MMKTALAALALAMTATTMPAAAQSLPEMKTVEVYGQPIRYYEAGQGPDLVLVHGLGSSAKFDWGKVIPELAKSYHVLAMDQLGFGTSPKPTIAYGIQTWVDMLDGFLKAKQVKDFALAGESLGGWISALYTIEAQQGGKMVVPRRLILTDAAGHKPAASAPPPRSWGPLTLEGTRAGLGMVFHDKKLVTDAVVREAFEARLAEGSQYTQESLFRNLDPASFVDDRLDAITVPTLIVWGADDIIVPLSAGQDYAAKIKGAKLAVIPECGHGPAIEKPDAYLAIVKPFLAGK